LSYVAKDFRGSGFIFNWLKNQVGLGLGFIEGHSEELRALKMRNRALEQQMENLKRASSYFARELSRNDLPIGRGSRWRWLSRLVNRLSNRGFHPGVQKWQRSPASRCHYDDVVLIYAVRDVNDDDPTLGDRFALDGLQLWCHLVSEC
jgi:hypothetical protein